MKKRQIAWQRSWSSPNNDLSSPFKWVPNMTQFCKLANESVTNLVVYKIVRWPRTCLSQMVGVWGLSVIQIFILESMLFLLPASESNLNLFFARRMEVYIHRGLVRRPSSTSRKSIIALIRALKGLRMRRLKYKQTGRCSQHHLGKIFI